MGTSLSPELYSRLAVSSSWINKGFSNNSTVLVDSPVVSVVSRNTKLYSTIRFCNPVAIISSDSVFILCCPFNSDGRIYPIPSAIARTPSLHLSRLMVSCFFKPIFSVSSSTCFFQVFLGHPRFFLPLTSRFRVTLKTLSSSLLSICPYHLTPFAVANRCIVSFNPNMSICSSVVFLSTTF